MISQLGIKPPCLCPKTPNGFRPVSNMKQEGKNSFLSSSSFLERDREKERAQVGGGTEETES